MFIGEIFKPKGERPKAIKLIKKPIELESMEGSGFGLPGKVTIPVVGLSPKKILEDGTKKGGLRESGLEIRQAFREASKERGFNVSSLLDQVKKHKKFASFAILAGAISITIYDVEFKRREGKDIKRLARFLKHPKIVKKEREVFRKSREAEKRLKEQRNRLKEEEELSK